MIKNIYRYTVKTKAFNLIWKIFLKIYAKLLYPVYLHLDNKP
jgi:hypothetical protein